MLEPKRILNEVAKALRSGHPIKLSEALDKLDKLSQSDPQTWELRAHIHSALGEMDEMVHAARTALELSPQSDYLAGFYADTLRRAGREAEAVSILEGLVSKGSTEPTNYLALSEYFTSNGRPLDAIRVLSLASTNNVMEGLEPVFLLHETVAHLLVGDIDAAKRRALESLSHLNKKPYQRFGDVPITAVVAINIERIPARWIDALARTITAWIREEVAGTEPRVTEIWSSELLHTLPYDDEPLTHEEMASISDGLIALGQGNLQSLDDVEKELGLL